MKLFPSVLKVRCHYCSKEKLPSQVLQIGTGGATMCLYCHEWHVHALSVLAGQPPKGCQECSVTFQQLRERAEGGDNTDVKMYLHARDGIYQLLCRTCSDAYERKRADLYGDTAYGHIKKLKGAK